MSTASRSNAQRQIVLGAISDTGKVRQNNEDSFCALLAPNTPRGVGGVLAVADGVGGHAAGEKASRMAVEGVVRLLGKGQPSASSVTSPDGRLRHMHDALTRINGEVFAAASAPETRGMGTTLSVAIVEGPSLWGGHLGDSRIYLYRDGTLSQLTPDHSWVAEEVARGAITAEDARRHPRRNLLTRAVGTQAEVEPTTLSAQLQQGDTLLLCSDGLHGLVTDDRIAAVLSSKEPDEAAKVLVNMANTAGGTDNVTVVVARIVSALALPASLWEEGSVKTVAAGASKGGSRLLAVLLFPLLLPFKLPWWLIKGIGRGFKGYR